MAPPDKKQKKQWKRRQAGITIGTLVLAIATVVADPLATIITDDDPVVVCSTDVSKYVALQKANPNTDFSVAKDSELNKQCHLNRVLETIKSKNPDQINPPAKEPEPESKPSD